MMVCCGDHSDVVREDVVREDAGSGTGLAGDESPWSHDEGDEDHGEGATLGDGRRLGVGLAQSTGNGVVCQDVLMIVTVGQKDARGKAGGEGHGIEEATVDLVEAFVDVDRPAGEGDVGNVTVLQGDRRLVPPIGSSQARNARIHKGIGPAADPGIEVVKPCGGAFAVEGGEDEG